MRARASRNSRADRFKAAFVAFVASTTAWLVVSVPAHADVVIEGQPGLNSLGFLTLNQLTDSTGAALTKAPTVVGADGRGGMVLYASTGLHPSVIDVEAKTLQQTGPAIATAPLMKSALADPSQHDVYLGSAASGLCALPIQTTPACTTGSMATPAEIALVDLTKQSNTIYTFPASTSGQNVIAMQVMHPADSAPILLALLYAQTDPTVAFTAGTSHTMTLFALDTSKLGSSDPASAVLWQYPITNCASTPSWTLQQQQDFLGTDADGKYAYFACRGFSFVGTNTTVQPSGAEVIDFTSAYPHQQSDTGSFTTAFYPNGSDASFSISGGDESHGMLFVASSGLLTKAEVFDSAHRTWTGSVPLKRGAYGQSMDAVATDSSTGRAYAVYSQSYVVSLQGTQVPAQQGAPLSLGDMVPQGSPAAVEPSTHRLFLSAVNGRFTHTCDNGGCTQYPGDDAIAVFEDTRPPAPPDTLPDPDALTNDIAITADTPVTYGAFASGYGAKALFVGGIHAAAPLLTTTSDTQEASICDKSQNAFCVPSTSDGNRAMAFGQVTGTEVSNSAARADAAPLAIDKTTSDDSSALSSYAVATALGPASGGQAPSAPPPPDQVMRQVAPASCSDFDASPGHMTQPGAVTSCDHAGQKASAGAAAPAAFTGLPVQVAYAASSTQVGRSETNEAVTSAIAEAAGITIAVPSGPTVKIGDIVATATSTAAGLHGTAKSTYQRSISDVTVTDASGHVVFACGFDGVTANGATQAGAGKPCDARALTNAVSAQAESPVVFLTPSTDSDPTVAGSPGGAQAEVIKSPYDHWNDYFLNGDDGWEVPALQVIVVGDQNQPSRFVLNLAGLSVESHDAIGLPPPPPPVLPAPTLALSLVDGSSPPVPLSGATFELQGPDGVAPQTCTTAADGVGDCQFANLQPGDYTVHEVTPPPGFAPADDYPLSLEAGQAYTLTFVNLAAIGSVDLSLASAGDSAGPLAGGAFAMFAGSSTLGLPVATCTTDSNGHCGFDNVPLGDYTMHQVTAPDGFLPSDDVPFSLTEPGQRASLNFVDSTPGAPAVEAVPPTFIPGKPAVPPHTEVIHIPGHHTPVAAQLPDLQPAAYQTSVVPPPVVQSASTAGVPPIVLGGGNNPVAAAGRVSEQLARLLTHSPRQAVLLLFVWIVLGLPVYLFIRRRQFIVATERA